MEGVADATLLKEWDQWDRESDEWAQEWNDAKYRLRAGTIVPVTIISHESFGVFSRIEGIPFLGLITITNFKDSGRMTRQELPPIGAIVEAVVLGPAEHDRQIHLGVKPSQLDEARSRIRSK